VFLFFGTLLLFSLSEAAAFSSSRYQHGRLCSSAIQLTASNLVKDTSPPDFVVPQKLPLSIEPTEQASICVIGAGVSGLTAAITAAVAAASENDDDGKKIVVFEATDRVGGRVQSDTTDDGFIMDRGFAVFIEEYPWSKALLDYDELSLGKFLPGALLKIAGETELIRVSDPLRNPADVITALLAPIGTLKDKIKLVPLIVNVRRKSIEALFEEPETDTLTALKERWGFSDEILNKFFRPFVEGIFLSPLEEQSSRMFSFVFKMFSEGSATLPLGGMKQVSEQLQNKAIRLGVDIRISQPISGIIQKEDGGYIVQTSDGKSRIESDVVVVATDVRVAQKLISQIPDLDLKEISPEINQRSVGCLYYSFEGNAPVRDPILILNGEGERRGSRESPINNVCFPTAVHAGFAPPRKGLCSVCILEGAMELYRGEEDELDRAIRNQLASWFPDYQCNIRDNWKLLGIYYIPNAQPIQQGVNAANVNGGRHCGTFRGVELPQNLFVCGDHMATSSLNGALESGVNAGNAAASPASIAITSKN